MKKYFQLSLFVCAIFLFLYQPVRAQIVIDGNFFDWDSTMRLDVAPNPVELTFAQGDPGCPDPSNPSYWADLDVHHAYVTDDSNYVYMRVQMADNANVSATATDTSYHGGGQVIIYISLDPGPNDTTGLSWGWWGNGYDLYIPLYPGPDTTYVYEQTGGTGWNFDVPDSSLKVFLAWNTLYNDCEVAIPRYVFKHPAYMQNFTPTDSIAIIVSASENNSPWRADYLAFDESNETGDIYHFKTGVTAVNTKVPDIPQKFSLSQNYPNPFNPSTRIEYSLPHSEYVTLKVYNIVGQEVKTIVNNYKNAGNYIVNFNADDIPSGVYFYSLHAGNFSQVKKMILLK